MDILLGLGLNNCKISTLDYRSPAAIVRGNYTNNNDIYSLTNFKKILNVLTQYDENIKHSSYFHTHYQLNPLNKTWFYDYILTDYISNNIYNFKVGPNDENILVTIGDVIFGSPTESNFRKCDGSKLLNSFEEPFSKDYTYDYYINMGTWYLPLSGEVTKNTNLKRSNNVWTK